MKLPASGPGFGVIPRVVLIAAPMGAVIGFFLNGARVDSETPRSLLHGAFIATVAAVAGVLFEIWFHPRLERMSPGAARMARALLFTLAGCFGYVFGGGLARVLLWGMPFFPASGAGITYSLLASSILAMAIGLGFYTFERMRLTLEQSVARLKEQEFAAKELELAREIQQRLLPPQEVSGDGYRVAARNLAAHFVAGDYYDVFRLSDGSIGLVVADVAGKGIGASLIMASAKAVLPLMAEGRSVAEAMSALNVKLAAELGKREFVALAFARFDPATGVAEVANAGLPDPYLLSDGSVRMVHVPGPRLPLGAMKVAAYESTTVQLARGDRLLLFTDGLPEAPLPSGEPLGYDALPALLAGDGGEPGAWLDTVFERIRSRSSETLADDWTALVLERV